MPRRGLRWGRELVGRVTSGQEERRRSPRAEPNESWEVTGQGRTGVGAEERGGWKTKKKEHGTETASDHKSEGGGTASSNSKQEKKWGGGGTEYSRQERRPGDVRMMDAVEYSNSRRGVDTTRGAGAKNGTEREAHPRYSTGRDGGGRTRGRSYVPPRSLDCNRTSEMRHQQGMPCWQGKRKHQGAGAAVSVVPQHVAPRECWVALDVATRGLFSSLRSRHQPTFSKERR